MKIVTILFILIAYATGGILIAAEENEMPLAFPVFSAPEYMQGDFADCSWYDLGCHAGNIAEAVLLVFGTLLFIVLIIVEFFRYVLAWVFLVFSVMFNGIDGAPFWVNLLLGLPFAGGIGIIIYKMFRKGDSED